MHMAHCPMYIVIRVLERRWCGGCGGRGGGGVGGWGGGGGVKNPSSLLRKGRGGP